MTTPRVFQALLLALTLAFAGCSGLDMFGKDAPPTSAQEQAALQTKADEAWNAGKYDRALTLYSLILQGQALTREAKLSALERSAKALIWIGRAPEALPILDNWAAADSIHSFFSEL